MLEHLTVPIQWKAGGDAGTLEGYASTFGNVDLGGDVVVKGAFAKTIANIKKNGIPLLADHVASTASVLGTIFDASEDSTGLKIKARFSSAASAQDVRTKLLEGHLDRMSIGYDPVEYAFMDGEDGSRNRKLIEIKLWEASVVVFPMNPEAAISRVKSVAATLTPADRGRLVADLTNEAAASTKTTVEDRRAALTVAVRRDRGDAESWVRDFDEAASTVWFEVWDGDKSGTYEQAYSVDADGNVELTGEPTAVRAVTTYTPTGDKSSPTPAGSGNAGGDEPPAAAKAAKPGDEPGTTTAPADEAGSAPDEGAAGWDRYKSAAVMAGRDPEAVASTADVAGARTRLELLEADIAAQLKTRED